MTEEKAKHVRNEEVLAEKTLTLEPIQEKDGNGTRPRDIHYAQMKVTLSKDGEADKVSWTWQVSTTVVIDGEAVPEIARNRSPRKALETLIGKVPPGSVTLDNYVEPPFDDEFFTNKPEIKTAAKAALTYDVKATVGEDEKSLGEWRGELEQRLESANESEVSAQAEIMAASETLNALHESVFKGNLKDTISFVKGDGAGDNAKKMPLLNTLGSGQNAVREFLYFGQLSDRLKAILPVNTTSGKGLDRFRMEAIKSMVHGAKGDSSGPVYRYMADNDVPLPNWVGEKDKEEPAFDVESAAAFLRTIAMDQRLFNVTTAESMSLEEVADAMDAAAEAQATKFLGEGGKHFNMYNPHMYNAAIKTFGMNYIAFGGKGDEQSCTLAGANAFRVAVAKVTALHDAIESKNDSAITKAMDELHSQRKNPLHGIAATVIRAEMKRTEGDKQRQEVLDEVGEDDKVITKTARKSFATLDTVAAAARLFNLLQARHGEGTKNDVSDVMRELRAMVDKL